MGGVFYLLIVLFVFWVWGLLLWVWGVLFNFWFLGDNMAFPVRLLLLPRGGGGGAALGPVVAALRRARTRGAPARARGAPSRLPATPGARAPRPPRRPAALGFKAVRRNKAEQSTVEGGKLFSP